MTIYRLLSFWTVVRILCKKAGKRSCDTEWRIYCFWWHLTVFLTTAADPSHSLRMTPCRPVSFWTGQEYFVRKQESGHVTRSEKSITLMTSYGLPYHGNRHFTFASDDALPYTVVLHGARILCEKTGNEIVTQSEESITLMGSRIPYLWCCFLFSCI